MNIHLKWYCHVYPAIKGVYAQDRCITDFGIKGLQNNKNNNQHLYALYNLQMIWHTVFGPLSNNAVMYAGIFIYVFRCKN